MTSAFRSGLFFEDLSHEDAAGNKIRLKLVSPLVYDSAILGYQVIAPAGFVTDLGSVPQALWNIVPPIGRADGGYVIHDWLYQNGKTTRKQADDVLREALEVRQVRKSLRMVIWLGVRAGGWRSWNGYRQRAATEQIAKALHSWGKY